MSDPSLAHRMWRWCGQQRPPFAEVPGPGQESVWDQGLLTFALVAAAEVVFAECNERGAANGCSIGATSEAAIGKNDPAPKGCGQKAAWTSLRTLAIGGYGLRFAPRPAAF